MQLVKRFTQDLTQDVKVRQCGTLVFNADNEANVIEVELLDNGQAATIIGSVSCAVICSDGSTVPVTNGTYDGNVVTVTLTGDCGVIPGPIGVGIQIVDNGVKATIFKAIYNVELYETTNVVDPNSRITLSVGDLIAAIDDAVNLLAISSVHITKSGTDSVAITDAANGVGMDVSATIQPEQEAGTPALDNVLPFAMRDSVAFSVTGENDSTSVTVNLPSEITGGVLRVDPEGTAHLSKTWNYYEFDGTETWSLLNGSSGNPKLLRCQYDKDNNRFPRVTTVANTRCSALPYGAALTSNDATGLNVYNGTGNDYAYVHVRLADMTGVTTDSWKATLAELYAAGTPFAINYRLYTPGSSEWEADAVTPFGGQNTISTTPTATSMTVTYTADMQKYADRIAANIAPSEQRTAQSAHAVGALFLIDNVLYQATSAIAQGDTLTVGVNIQQTTIAAVIAAL